MHTDKARPVDAESFAQTKIGGKLLELVQADRTFSDILIEEDAPAVAKGPRGWETVDSLGQFRLEEIGQVLEKLDTEWNDTIKNRAINRPIDMTDWRLRINAYRANAGEKVMMAVRKLPARPLALKDTGLPASVRLMIEQPRGLVLIAGATGSGKSTTLAALIESINESRATHVVTVEDPIEYVFQRKKSVFSQREVGVDVRTFYDGVRDAMRQCPNVIGIGEIRDRDTAETALLASESGHLVLGTLHASSSPGAVQKLLAFFNSMERDAKLATIKATLVGVVAQVLMPSADGAGYGLAAELLFNQHAQFSHVLGEPDKVVSALERKEDKVSRPMADAMLELVAAKRVTKAEVLRSIPPGQRTLYDRLRAALEGYAARS